MQAKPVYDPSDPLYWDGGNLRAETERIFRICADCRLCNKFCGSFPKLFDVVDEKLTDEKYSEVDMERLVQADVDEVVDLCFQCKLCHVNCPFTPGSHEWAVDFPRLLGRLRAHHVRRHGLPLRERFLADPDLAGRIGSWTAPLANLAAENPLHRAFLEGTLGIHRRKRLPRFAWKTFAARFRDARREPKGEPSARIAYFPTCFVNYNEPGIGMDTLEVMARNNVDVAFSYQGCCGMPAWHAGDMDAAIAAARRNVEALLPLVREGRKVVVTNPTCSQMFRMEYPGMLGGQGAGEVAAAVNDPMELLASLASKGKLNRDFRTPAGEVTWHMPCHLRAQNIGYKTRDVLSLLPGTTVRVVEECSGHDGTWSMKKEHFEDSLRWGAKAFEAMKVEAGCATCSDCPLAAIQIGQATGRTPLNPLQILARSYRGEPIVQDGDQKKKEENP